MREQQVKCLRCGACCEKGGPALHGPDLDLVRTGKLPLDDLITIRRGELAYNPVSGRVEPVAAELVKIRGIGDDWCCCYYNAASKGCSVYENRPMACGVLKCWQPEETLALVGKDLLNRLDILEKTDPLRAVVVEYEQLCPTLDIEKTRERLSAQDAGFTTSVQRQVNADLAFRDRVVRAWNLPLTRELFLFARPLFQLLQAVGCVFSSSPLGLKLVTIRKIEHDR